MVWLQLSVDFARAVAWPLVVVVLTLVLRPHLPTLVDRDHTRLIKRVKVGPVEAEWEADVQEGAREIEQDVEKNPASYNQSMPLRLLSIAKKSPRGAVLTAFAEVESQLRNLMSKSDINDTERATVIELSRSAAENGLISETLLRAFDAIRRLRNTAAHASEEVSYTESLEFLGLADAIMAALQERIDNLTK